jgi:hypothetical protein
MRSASARAAGITATLDQDEGGNVPRFRGTIVIARPVEVVFDVVADVRNEPSYKARMLRVDPLTGPDVGVGTRWSALLRSGRWPTNVVIERTDYQRPRVLGSVLTAPDGEVSVRVTFEPVAEGTRVDWEEVVRPVKLNSALSALRRTRRARKDWGDLKTLLESSVSVPLTAADAARVG